MRSECCRIHSPATTVILLLRLQDLVIALYPQLHAPFTFRSCNISVRMKSVFVMSVGIAVGARFSNGVLSPCEDNADNCLVAVIGETGIHKGCSMRFLDIDESLVAIVDEYEGFPDLRLPCAHNVAWWDHLKPASVGKITAGKAGLKVECKKGMLSKSSLGTYRGSWEDLRANLGVDGSVDWHDKWAATDLCSGFRGVRSFVKDFIESLNV